MAISTRQLPVVLALGTTRTLAWASSYYLVAILADLIVRDFDTSSTAVFAAFSAALLISTRAGSGLASAAPGSTAAVAAPAVARAPPRKNWRRPTSTSL